MLVLSSRGWVLGHTITRNKGTLLFIKTKESLRMHLKEAQESERNDKKKMKKKKKSKQGRRQNGTSARKSVAMTICGLFLFSFPFIYFFYLFQF